MMVTDSDSSTMTVRVMRADDLSALVEIDGLASGAPRPAYLQSKVQLALDSEHGMVIALVAEERGKVAGFTIGQVHLGEFGIRERVATVDTVGIHPDFQVQGVAGMLIDEFVSQARQVGVERIRTMVDWKQWDLMGFFRALGFAPGPTIVLERPV